MFFYSNIYFVDDNLSSLVPQSHFTNEELFPSVIDNESTEEKEQEQDDEEVDTLSLEEQILARRRKKQVRTIISLTLCDGTQVSPPSLLYGKFLTQFNNSKMFLMLFWWMHLKELELLMLLRKFFLQYLLELKF